MRVIILHLYTKFKVSALLGLVTLTFDRVNLKVVCELHVR